jgi:hypothetical protein
MEVILQHGFGDESMQLAYAKFLTHYRKHFAEATDMDYSPKNPGTAANALVEYCKRYKMDAHDYEVLYTEIAGAVPVTADVCLHFRIDGILRDRRSNKYVAIEHKTTKRAGRQWIDQWPLSIQIGAYTHVLHCLYGSEDVYGVLVNGAVFHKTAPDFIRVPCRKTQDTMNNWHYTVSRAIHSLQSDLYYLTKATPDQAIMEAFPQNPEACTKYFGCAYHDFCSSWGNPLRYVEQVPLGFVENRWNPAEREATTQLGIVGGA